MYNSQDIAFVIKQTAKGKNLTVKQLLEKCNLSINTISDLSKGTQISYISFSKIADCLDCSVDYLLGRTDNPNFEKAVISSKKKIFKQSLQAVIDQLEELKNSIDNP